VTLFLSADLGITRIARIQIFWFGLDDPFDLEGSIFEVQEQTHLQTGDVQVAQKLCGMIVVKSFHDFGFKDHPVIDDQISDRVADRTIFIEDRVAFLLVEVEF
jgi:hypothetical protein